MDEVVKHKRIWIMLLLCPIVFFLVQHTSIYGEKIIYTNTDQEMTRKLLKKVFYHEKKDSNSHSVEVHFPLFTDIHPHEEGYLLTFDETIPVLALESGLIVYTGYHKKLGKTITVYYDDGITVTYGYLDSFSHLPYTSIDKGHVIAMKNPGLLYIRVEQGKKVFDMEETIEWLESRS